MSKSFQIAEGMMAQLHFYVPDDIAARIRRRAKSRRLSVSRFLAEIVKRELGDDWPEGYFEEVIGGWEGTPLERAPQGEYERRESL